ncbi:hypothetical protein SH467x_002707 [Pirellulaceae bacterium SH467]
MGVIPPSLSLEGPQDGGQRAACEQEGCLRLSLDRIVFLVPVGTEENSPAFQGWVWG